MDANACGNPRIDALAHRGRLQSVWQRLEWLVPELQPHTQSIWLARRDGRIRRLVEHEARYHALLGNASRGPQSDAEWTLLAEACLEAIGKLQPVTLRNVA